MNKTTQDEWDTWRLLCLSEGEHTLIVDGMWIIGGTVKVSDVRAGRIRYVGDSASIQNVRGSASLDESAKSHIIK